MKTIHEKITSDYRVVEDTVLHGMIVGHVVVENQSTLILHGMIVGNLIIDPTAEAVVHGMVNGNITNHGKCEIFGTINGKVSNSSGQLILDPNSQINTI